MTSLLPVASGVEFRVVDGFPDYCIGNNGSPWTRKVPHGCGAIGHWRPLIGDIDCDGYHRVVLRANGKKTRKAVHRLVLEAFVGPRPPGMECLHGDGNPRNNRVGNLSWGTQKENGADKVRHGNSTRGTKNFRAKLSEEQVIEIRDLCRRGAMSQEKVAARFGVAQVTISRIFRGEQWKHVG